MKFKSSNIQAKKDHITFFHNRTYNFCHIYFYLNNVIQLNCNNR
ncbi:hypothetical protein [Plasmodium yoelii yoelii]|uniref:Uncharacterized protein n=1 Tax=Plasmodium yoelii yoelii TaxID=73239 RepID=Q7RBB7_PLAYO|nr:hypothetical protein [Plasmodium yoelii yoelii]